MDEKKHMCDFCDHKCVCEYHETYKRLQNELKKHMTLIGGRREWLKTVGFECTFFTRIISPAPRPK